MEGSNMLVTPVLPSDSWPSNNNQDNTPNQQVPVADQTVAKCGRPPHLGRQKDPKNMENMDSPKMLKRIMASRNYSKKYRMKQMEYIMHLETEVKALQAEVTINAPRIRYVERQNALLRAENGSIKHKLSAYNAELMFKEAQYEELKREREMLKQIYAQNQQKSRISTQKMTIRDEAPNYQRIDMGEWNKSMLPPFIDESSAFENADQPSTMDQIIDQSFGNYGLGPATDPANQQ